MKVLNNIARVFLGPAAFICLLCLVLLPAFAHAQVDSTALKIGAASSSVTTVGIFAFLSSLVHWPTFLSALIACIIVVLTAVQYVLKAIPTPYSIKWNSWVGAILSWFTAFQKDVLHGDAPALDNTKS